MLVNKSKDSRKSRAEQMMKQTELNTKNLSILLDKTGVNVTNVNRNSINRSLLGSISVDKDLI